MSTQAMNSQYEMLEAVAGPSTPPFTLSKARDREAGRVVALQTLPAALADGDARLRRRFQDAVRMAQALESPAILEVYDQGETDDGDLYVVREQIRGITLAERIRRIAPFTLTVAVDFGLAVAEALVAAHRVGVSHGDLRPVHVIYTPEGQIKTADFSYGAVVADAQADAQIDAQADAGADPVRAAYLAPELRLDDAPSSASDLYALGAMLYEMLTGVLPLAGGTRVTSPRDVNPNIPPALDGLVQKALHASPHLRYRSAAALLGDLQAIRDALRNGKSLAWSPLGEKRVPRASALESTLVGPRPELEKTSETEGAVPPAAPVNGSAARPSPLGGAGEELEEERTMREREPSRWLGRLTAIMFVIAVLSVIGLVTYATRFLEVPNDIQVPNLIGKTFDDAKRVATQQHFTLVESPDSNYSDSMPENQIYRQDPQASRTIKADKEVTVWRSLGPRLLVVPPIVGTTQEYATNALQKASLPLGTVDEEYSDTVQKGVVVKQSPDGSSKVARNTAVNFTVSKGKEPPDAPEGAEGKATGPETAEITWRSAPRADSYTVIRSLDGDTATVAQGLKDTKFSDTGLKPNTTYSYTINAVSAAGQSGPSESALITTEAKPDVQPVLPPDTVVVPDSTDTGGGSVPDTTARMRPFTIDFRVPRRPRGPHHVQIEVQDITGNNLFYDETHDAGEKISAPVQAFGNKVTFRIFLDGKLVKQQIL